MNRRFAFHAWRRDIGNFALFKYRDVEGFIVSGQNSGTKWLKSMLSQAIAHHFERPPPAYTNNADSNDFIGHPRHERRYPETPRLASTHTIAHPLVQARPVRALIRFPPYVVLVRDIRAALVSHYEKWREDYGIGFSEFLEGDVAGGRHWADFWWHIRFCNRWGPIVQHYPARTLLVRYEDLQQQSAVELGRIRDFLGLPLSDADLAHGIAESSKKKMSARINPALEGGRRKQVRQDERDPMLWYTVADRERFQAIVDDNLRWPMGYDYTDWRPAAGEEAAG